MLTVWCSLDGEEVVRRIQSYAIEPILRHASLMRKGDIVEISPLFSAEAFDEDTLSHSSVYGLLIRNGETGEVIQVSSIYNDAILGGVEDILLDVLSQKQAGSNQEEQANIEYRICSEEGENGHIIMQSRSRLHIEEGKISDLDPIVAMGNPAGIPKIFTKGLWDSIKEFVITETRRELIAAMKTSWMWDPELNTPYLVLHTLVPFGDEGDKLTSSEGYVQAHGGSSSFTRILGERVSLLHTHIMESEESHRVAFISKTDKSFLRRHLTDQVSLIANVVMNRPDLGPAFHIYSWANGNIVRDGFYVSMKSDL